jgi:hypothetical protein
MSEPLNYQPSHSAAYYVPPTQFDRKRLPIAFLITAVVIGLGAVVYAKIQLNIDQIHIRGAAAVVFALAVGGVCMAPVRAGRVRSPALAACLGAILSLFALYVMWVVWVHDYLNRTLGFNISYSILIRYPSVLWRVIKSIDRTGAWRLNGDLISGFILFLWWFGEGAMIVAAGTLFPLRGLFTSDPICRQCGARCKRVSGFPYFAGDRQSEIASAIDTRSFAQLSALPAPVNENAPELRIRLMSCPRCGNMHVVTLNRIAWVRGKNGRATVKITLIVNELLITSEEAGQLTDVCAEIQDRRAAEENPEN